MRSQRAWTMLAATFPFAVLGSAAWVALVRFTLLEVPQWPSLLFPLAWAAWFTFWLARKRVTTAQAARYLDHTLGLDERFTTYVELARRSRRKGRPLDKALARSLYDDLQDYLRLDVPTLPSVFKSRVRPQLVVAAIMTLLALAGAMSLPTGLDAVRAERATLRQTVAAQLGRIEALRAEIVSRPGLSEDVKQAILGDLDHLAQQLGMPDINREEILAAVADAQQKVRDISPTSTADFDGIMVAGQIVWARSNAVQNSRAASPGSEIAAGQDEVLPDSLSPRDLGLAADAAEFLAGYVPLLRPQQRVQVATSMERASQRAGTRDPQLVSHLNEAGANLRSSTDKDKEAQDALFSVAERFRAADQEYESAAAIENTLAKLDEGRQSISQAGKPPTKRGQVGFRRQSGGDSTDAGAAAPGGQNADSAGADSEGAGSEPSYNSGNVGGNAASFGGVQAGGQQGPPANGGQPGQQPSSGGGPAGGPNSDVAGGTAGGGQDDGSQGTLQGEITGPVGGAGGAISRVQNPAGQGDGGSSAPAPVDSQPPDTEHVYVPAQDGAPPSAESSSGAGQAAPESPNTDGLSGRVGEGGGGEETRGQTGAGTLMPIHTPYKEVIGQYAERATESLDRAYIPPDAKDYVREYFTQLGK
ncbi:MAG TPA: hypothetical protein VEY08_03165 [Chloroflexia bacterium]|nr:hypothetical protein [Chloroflexia bacterium]